MSDWILNVEGLSYAYGTLSVLKDIYFRVLTAQRIAIIGVSGVGKSTFLHILGLLDTPTAGRILVQADGHMCETQTLQDHERASLRCHLIGTVYQFHHLLNEFTALENVMIPQMIAGISLSIARKKAKELLELVSLTDRLTHFPSQLSGGQQQRVAIARALANDPLILLADEPTGNLDEDTAQDVFLLLHRLSQERNLAIVMTTHNKFLAQKMDVAFSLHHGMLIPEKDLSQ